MALFHHIVYPVDFSPRSLSVGPFVAAMAHRMNAPITLLHSIPMPRGWFGGIEGAYPPFFDITTLQEDARRRIEQLKDQPQFDGLDIECVVNMGDPAVAIIELTSKLEDCLVMIPTHGYGKFRNLLLGSVTGKVLHDSRSAVWTDAHIEDAGTDQPVDPRRILCAVALDGHDENLILKAFELAGESAGVRLVHAMPVEQMRPQKYFALEFDRFLMDIAKEHIAELQHKLGVELQACVRAGAVSAVVRQTALLHGSDLIVAGRGVIRAPLGRLRTNAYAIIRDAPCPVLSF